MNKARKLSKRRDRRKAKASKWRRQGKSSMGGRVGHGPNGSTPTATMTTPKPGTISYRMVRPDDRMNMIEGVEPADPDR